MERTHDAFHAIALVAVAAVAACAVLAGLLSEKASADQLEAASPYSVEEVDGMPEGLETDAWPLSLEDFIIDFSR